ncbi:MAG: hypothetical protein ABIZ52_07635 [Candidatus Limnocylindrales bacterium]
MLVALAAPAAALAEQPSRVRELSCSDGTLFTGQQVRIGSGTPPRTFRNVDPSGSPVAFVFFAADVIAPDGTVIEQFTWDHSQGVDGPFEMVTCTFIIPVGGLAGSEANFYGFFVPA